MFLKIFNLKKKKTRVNQPGQPPVHRLDHRLNRWLTVFIDFLPNWSNRSKPDRVPVQPVGPAGPVRVSKHWFSDDADDTLFRVFTLLSILSKNSIHVFVVHSMF